MATWSSNQLRFASRFIADTGLDGGVVMAWMAEEEPIGANETVGYHLQDWLNVGITDSGPLGAGNPVWQNPETAADATANWIKGTWSDPGFGFAAASIRAILNTVGQSPQAQITAIQHSGWASSGYPDFLSLYNQYKGTAPAPGQPGTGATGGSGGGGTTGAATQLTGNTSAEAFVAELQFPSMEDQTVAIALGAEHKGLMHDQSLLPFVQQLCQASLRSFQSLPDGSFYAFYPDYFGEMGHHDPYWEIHDIEILDGGINLSDDALATHVFAVGDNCLALDTPIPTPDGWTTIEALQVGDWVLGSDGCPTQVLTTSNIHDDHPCFRVIFEDGACIVTDDQHRWETRTFRHNAQRALGGDSQVGIYSTAEIASNHFVITDSQQGWGRFNHRVKVTAPLDLPERALPIDPYLFGYWLGDGDNTQMRISVAPADYPHLASEIERTGYSYRAVEATSTGYGHNVYWRVSIHDQRSRLRELGVLYNKHIPTEYLRASAAQRLAVLQGLMDSDGSCTNYCQNHQTNERLAKDLRELALSLGFRTNWSRVPGRNGSRAQYDINFAPQPHCNVFRLPRKAQRYAQRLVDRATTTSQYRAIVSVDSVASVPVRCIGVDTPDHLFLVGEAMIPTHNTWPVNQELLNMLNSAGAINIFNAFVTTDIIDTTTWQTNNGTGTPDAHLGKNAAAGTASKSHGLGLSPGIMHANEAVNFLKRYGARPLVQNYPMVRSGIYEMLLAYQQFMLAWSNQFKTPFTFTFMPEIFPGGKVAFPQHGIQMYVDSVTHSWDYGEGGFTTTANLAAPALMVGVNAADFPEVPPHMVRAMIEPVRNKDISKTPQQLALEQQQQQQAASIDQGVGQVAGAVWGEVNSIVGSVF